MAAPRRLLGLFLLVLGVVPLYRLLDPAVSGWAAEFTIWFMDIHLESVWSGLIVAALLALAGAMFTPRAAESWGRRVTRNLADVPLVPVALGFGAIATMLGVLFSLLVLEGKPNLIDSFAQLLHARYWAAGALAGPVSDSGGFWAIQNSLFTERGWVSQYPPGHVLLLALGLVAGAPWLVGPVLTGAAVVSTVLTADRLLPARRGTVLLAGAALALSPFLIILGASYMNHVTAGAFVALGAYGLVRAWQGHGGWAVMSGAAFAFAFATRPLSTLTMGVALVLLVPFIQQGPRLERFVRLTGLMALGALPLLILFFAYNQYFFGHPLTSGYDIAMGPQMKLGFILDPWGNVYGWREALAYTNADLMALGVNMFESPLSSMVIIGGFLLLARRLEPGERVVVGWAFAPVVSNFFYWHHGNFMGPRMLHEAAPAWTLLFIMAAVALVRMVPSTSAGDRYRPRTGIAFALVAATAAGLVLFTPQRALSYGGGWHEVARTPLPPVQEPSVVFVHDAWRARIAMTLASEGYRLDLIETLIRQNSTCEMQTYVMAVVAGDGARRRQLMAQLDTIPRASGSGLTIVHSAPGSRVDLRPGEVLTTECQRQAWSDRRGILDIAPLLWRGDLHGRPGNGALVVRDLGPERNAAFLAHHPQRRPWVYMMPDTAAATPVLVPYEHAMELLWGVDRPPVLSRSAGAGHDPMEAVR